MPFIHLVYGKQFEHSVGVTGVHSSSVLRIQTSNSVILYGITEVHGGDVRSRMTISFQEET